jgi:hypothetical protein
LGQVFVCAYNYFPVCALIAQVQESAVSEARNKESQDRMLQITSQTARSVNELRRLMQPLENPEITVFLDLTCGPAKYEKFCTSAQTQADKEWENHKKLTEQLPIGAFGATLPQGRHSTLRKV